MTPTDHALLQIWQANRGDPFLCEALFDECLAPKEYVDQLDAVRSAMCEEKEMTEPKACVGYMTSGILDNVIDLSNTWAIYPERRQEFRGLAIEQLQDARTFLNDLLDEITKQKAEAA